MPIKDALITHPIHSHLRRHLFRATKLWNIKRDTGYDFDGVITSCEIDLMEYLQGIIKERVRLTL